MIRQASSSAAAVLALGLAGVAQAAPSPVAAYSLAAPTSVATSGLVARAVVPAGSPCPRLMADGRALPMHWRRAAGGTGAAFSPVMVCERVIPPGTASAAVGGLTIPAAMPGRVDRIGIFDDSGCRIRAGSVTQDCADDRAWPLTRISRRLAASDPDVVLVPGDFFYRETACPGDEQPLCAGSPPPVGGMPFTD